MSTDSDIIKAMSDPVRSLLDLLLLKVNKVTAFSRHGQGIPKRHLEDLANFQVRVEELLEEFDKPAAPKLGTRGPCKRHLWTEDVTRMVSCPICDGMASADYIAKVYAEGIIPAAAPKEET